MNLITLLSGFISLLNLSLGIFVLLKNPKSKVNFLFFCLTLTVFLWISGILLVAAYFPSNTKLFAIIARFPFFSASLLVYIFFNFVQYFPRRMIKISILINFLSTLIILGIAILSLLTDLVVKDVTQLNHTTPYPIFGRLYSLWSAIFIFFFSVSIGILAWKYKSVARGIEKKQIECFFVGIIASALIAITTNLIIPAFLGPTSLWQIGPLALIFMVIFTTYAIIKHHLLNIRVIATELLVGGVLIILLADIFLSKSLSVAIFKTVLLALFGYMGFSLIKSVIKEIKRRKEMEKLVTQLKLANVKLQQLDKAKSEFLSIASHQLRTPLSIMKGYLSMILEGSYGRVSPKIKNITENLFQTNEQLIKLVNNLLNISRIEAGKIELQLENISIANLIKETIKEIEPEAKEKGLYIVYEEKTKIPYIRIDPDKIKQVLLNILDNAIKYTEKGGINITTQMQNSYVLIKITDTGVGMTREEIQNIFTSFKRGEAGEKLWTGGSGLGLYVAKKFVEMHKGKIWAESQGKNKGSTFFVRLPVQ